MLKNNWIINMFKNEWKNDKEAIIYILMTMLFLSIIIIYMLSLYIDDIDKEYKEKQEQWYKTCPKYCCN